MPLDGAPNEVVGDVVVVVGDVVGLVSGTAGEIAGAQIDIRVGIGRRIARHRDVAHAVFAGVVRAIEQAIEILVIARESAAQLIRRRHAEDVGVGAGNGLAFLLFLVGLVGIA